MLFKSNNQAGNIAIAMALAIIGLCSGVTMSLVGFKDTVAARLDFDGVQQLILLRSEANRGQTIVQTMDYSGDGFYLPLKYVKVVSSHAKNTFKLNTKVEKDNVSTGGGLYFTQGYNIKTLATTTRGVTPLSIINGTESMVRKYAVKEIRRVSFAGYHYFTDEEESTNGTPVYFWGPDVIEGKVHSNSDIWLRNGGGGTNEGWPTFLGPVYTTGTIRTNTGAPPYDQVFRAGYWEHVSPLEFDATASLIRQHGIPVGEISTDAPLQNTIMYVTLNGGGYTAMKGQIIERIDTTDVWQHFPPATGNYLFRNRFTMKDTIWTAIAGGSLDNSSAIVYSKLWLKGNVTGRQTWCSTDTLYLVDDITYTNTARGQNPDGGQTPNSQNRSDFLGIVSEKSILIQYGHKDPADSLRKHPNCGSDTDGIFIYGAMCALGQGTNSHNDGVFSFEYQHPHPSIQDQRVNNVLYTQIDLHKHKYPQLSNLPWPGGLDYPWYNPLWPERQPYMERGTIHLFGSVAQRRRGFVHRSTNDTEYANPDQVWNIPLDYCGGPSGQNYLDADLGPIGTPHNAEGATGSGVGYKKDYHFDNRFSSVTPPDFPEVHVKGGLTPFDGEAWTIRKPPSSL